MVQNLYLGSFNWFRILKMGRALPPLLIFPFLAFSYLFFRKPFPNLYLTPLIQHLFLVIYKMSPLFVINSIIYLSLSIIYIHNTNQLKQNMNLYLPKYKFALLKHKSVCAKILAYVLQTKAFLNYRFRGKSLSLYTVY